MRRECHPAGDNDSYWPGAGRSCYRAYSAAVWKQLYVPSRALQELAHS